jgi:hypothetical protein
MWRHKRSDINKPQGDLAMSSNFAGVVEESYIVEERRDEILRNCEEGQKEYEEGKLVFTSNVDDLMASLSLNCH